MKKEPTREEYKQVIYGLLVLRDRMKDIMIHDHITILDELIEWMRFYMQGAK